MTTDGRKNLKIPNHEYSPIVDAEAKHDNKDGPCKCGAWHNPNEFEKDLTKTIKYDKIVKDESN